mmetsp:Transcript_9464/g.30909  ORF Transcript_9464/g.30909 Transcript_9464/m.30909 type:complete len:309 (+) Transcript_9464:267-1193(+)
MDEERPVTGVAPRLALDYCPLRQRTALAAAATRCRRRLGRLAGAWRRAVDGRALAQVGGEGLPRNDAVAVHVQIVEDAEHHAAEGLLIGGAQVSESLDALAVSERLRLGRRWRRPVNNVAARRRAGRARRLGGEHGRPVGGEQAPRRRAGQACGTLPRAPHDEHSLGVGRGDQLLDEPAVLEKVVPERPAVERDYLVANLEQRERGRVCCDGLHAHRAAAAAAAASRGRIPAPRTTRPSAHTRSRGLLGALLDRFGLVGADVRVDAVDPVVCLSLRNRLRVQRLGRRTRLLPLAVLLHQLGQLLLILH